MVRRTQAGRTAATRAALVDAGRQLFAEHGFAGVGTEAIVAAAQVSRGGMYHHFADKKELFAAVLDVVEADVTQGIAEAALAGGSTDFVPTMLRAVNYWLDACEATEIQRIVLLDGPSVLGWERWRAVIQPYGMALVEAMLTQAIAEGSVDPLPVRPLAHTLLAVVEEAAMYVVAADDRDAARRDMVVVMTRVLESLANTAH